LESPAVGAECAPQAGEEGSGKVKASDVRDALELAIGDAVVVKRDPAILRRLLDSGFLEAAMKFSNHILDLDEPSTESVIYGEAMCRAYRALTDPKEQSDG
jgi:hypothetical protein